MAVLKGFVPIDMTPSQGGGDPAPWLRVEQATATTIVLSDGTYTETYRGRFTYDDNDDPSGRLSSIVAADDGYLLMTISAIGKSAGIVFETLNSDAFDEALAYILSSNDRLFGSRWGDGLLGYDGNDTISGGGGNDLLLGGKGLDRLLGGNGADTLDGGPGGDRLEGGNGNDRYVTDNVNDLVIEAAGAGIDTILTSVSRGMAANVENLTLTGTRAIGGVGNGLANTLRGNDAANGLVGGAGDDWIYGGRGADRLTGGTGTDHLVGGAGADTFFFHDAAGQDFVHAFERGLDRLNLAGIDADATTAGNQAFTFLGSGSFTGTAGELAYARGKGILAGDVTGDGVADFEIRIANAPALTGADLIL